MIYTLLIVIVAGAVLETCLIMRRRIFRSRAKFILAGAGRQQDFGDTKLLESLPEPVRRYLKRALPEGLPIVRTARLRHDGFFRTSLEGKWEKIRGEQYISGVQPGFVWKGVTKLFSAVDSFIENKGNLSVWLFSALPIVNKAGPDIDRAEVLRWLAEGALVPSNLLPSEDLQWLAVDESSAIIMYTFRQRMFSLLVRFNTHNEIISVEAKRPYNNGVQQWKGTFSNYKSIGGHYVPTGLEACWIIDGVEKPYARFTVRHLEFNASAMF